MSRRTMSRKSPTADITKIGRIASPKGVAAYAYLDEPDEAFGKTQYRITVYFTDKTAPDYVAFVKSLKDVAKEHGADKLPIKLVDQKMVDKANEKGYESHPVGTPYLQFTTNYNPDDPRPIPVFNAKAERDDTLRVFGGDIVRVEGSMVRWEINGDSGIKIYLNAVQLLHANRRAATGSTFQTEEEFLSDDLDEAPEGMTFTDRDALINTEDDDLDDLL